MNEFVATVIGEVNAALKKKGWKKRGRAPSIEAIVEKTTELLRVATDKELAAAYGDDGQKHKGGGALDHFSRTDRRSRALCLEGEVLLYSDRRESSRFEEQDQNA